MFVQKPSERFVVYITICVSVLYIDCVILLNLGPILDILVDLFFFFDYVHLRRTFAFS